MRNRFALTLLSGILLLSACAPQQAVSPSPEPSNLKGTAWTVTKIKGDATVAASQPTLEFADGKVSGTSGCNLFFGDYTQEGAGLKFDPIGSTQMYCAETSDQESAFFDALDQVSAARKAGEGVELTNSAAEVMLTLVTKEPEPTKPLEKTEWTLTGIADGDAVSSIVGDKRVTLTIADGKLHASVCNQINGSVTVDGQSLKVGQLISTRMACPSEEETIQEGAVTSILEAATTFAIEGSTLTVTAAEKSLVFEAS